jgi:hypothetical protein
MRRLTRMAATLVLATVAGAQDELSDPNAAATEAAALRVTLELQRLTQDVTALRMQVDKLQTTLDLYVNGMIAELQDENTRLRRQLRRAYGDDPEAALAIPTPDRDVLEDALRHLEPAALAPAQEAPPLPGTAFHHTVITEWGRSVEEAAQLGENVQSLKGMILAVPEGSTDEQLRGLAQEMRAQYANYDNINIEVFVGEDEARAFADGNAAAGTYRVLSISKHAPSGRDTAVLIRPDRTEEIAVSAP